MLEPGVGVDLVEVRMAAKREARHCQRGAGACNLLSIRKLDLLIMGGLRRFLIVELSIRNRDF